MHDLRPSDLLKCYLDSLPGSLADDPQLLAEHSRSTAADAARRFDAGHEVDDYLAWFAQMREQVLAQNGRS
ncbi:MAG: hypothetical protein AB1916_01335 [Thermodesulfobacteriota bacterium]